MDARAKRIADGLSAAERGKQDLEAAEKRVADELQKARQQATEIVLAGEKRAHQIVEDAAGLARDESARIVADAKTEIDQEVMRTKEALRQQVAVLVVSGAQQILRREIDPARHALIFFVLLQYLTIFEGRFSSLLRATIAALMALCISITYACYFTYSSGLNIAFAASVLNSSVTEIRAMSIFFAVFALVAVVLFCLQYFSHETFKKISGTKCRLVTGILLIYAVSSVFYIANEEVKCGVEKDCTAAYLDRTPFYNLSFFLRAWDEQSRLKAMSGIKFSHTYRTIAPRFDEVVVVVGESARRDKLHSYGYDRDTTPMHSPPRIQGMVITRQQPVP